VTSKSKNGANKAERCQRKLTVKITVKIEVYGIDPSASGEWWYADPPAFRLAMRRPSAS
jgi:hypothetical protein